ncbi:MAG: hydroxylamine reductase [bacterium]
MFCFQCEQTTKGVGCTGSRGVCGKSDETAALQDALIHATKGLSAYAHRARALGVTDEEINIFTIEALFSTVTNVNFDADRVAGLVNRAVALRAKAKELYEQACVQAGKTPESLDGPAAWTPPTKREALAKEGEKVSVTVRQLERGDDVAGLEELLVYGIKGIAAYADHAQILGQSDDVVFAFIHEALDFISRPRAVDQLLGLVLRAGEVNLRAMELLDAGNTGTYGHPEPTGVRTTAKAGKAILVSGHDLKDLEALLQETRGRGINIYTHGEMLPAHAYPGLKKYEHLVGNYGGAWQDQRKEFEAFPGSILMTTNCIQKPKDTYQARIFTAGLVAWPGVAHIEKRDFSPLIEAALEAPGFAEDGETKSITIGFARQAVLSVADKIVKAVKSGDIKHFFLIGGCDGAKPGRNYYTELAEAVPRDCVILTLACGKYRFNKLELGDIGGIPRLLDVGQCNDAYSAIQIAVALANAFKTDVNSLPLSMVLSWYEQKAVCILLTLLHLGIKNIRLGPTLPAFVTPNVLNVLVEKFGIKPTTTAEKDLQEILK